MSRARYSKSSISITSLIIMARRQKDLGDWEVLLEENDSTETSRASTPATPTRRSRRRDNIDDSVKLQRQEDGLTIQAGDCLLTANRDGETSVCIIARIQLGIKTFVEMDVAQFASKSDISMESLPESYNGELSENELFITSELRPIAVSDIIGKVSVLSSSEFSEVVLDESSSTSIYLCRGGCDEYGEKFSTDLDFQDWKKLFKQNYRNALLYIAENTLIVISPKKRKGTGNNLKQRMVQLLSPSKVNYAESSSDSESDDFVDAAEERSDDELDELEEEDEEDKPKTPSKKRRGRTPLLQRKTKQRRTPRDSASVQRLQDVLSPLKKGFKVKSGNSPKKLPSLTANTPSPGGSPGPTGPEISTSSEAFLKLKEKLHTSTKLASLPCRDDEFTSVYMNIESAIQEETGCCIYVSGTPGVGKTATIREVVKTLQLIIGEGVNDFDYLELNCLKLLAPNSAYEKLWEFISGIKVTPTNAALLLEDHFKNEDTDANRKPLVVLMDEIDQAFTRSQDVMYNFFNWPTYPHSKLIIIAVANTMDLPEKMLTNKISSRIGLRRIQFVGYTFQELEIIIKNRLNMLSEKSRRKVTIGPDAIGYAARKVASVSGDARRALAICRRAVEVAESSYLATLEQSSVPEEEQVVTIRIDHINKAINEMVNSPLAQFVSTLSFASKLILVGVLLRSRRMGFAENTLGDVTDEMKNSLNLLTSKESSDALEEIDPGLSYADLLYGKPQNLRLFGMARLVNELAEFGILAQQNLRSERYRTVSLNVSEEEISSILKRDKVIAAML